MTAPSGRAERDKRYRKSHPDKRQRQRKGDRHTSRNGGTGVMPFVGCDGEGCGVDSLGRQNYMLFRMGDAELFTGAPLTTAELLEFIVSQPRGLYVGFSFGYDVTMILRDLPGERRARLLADREVGAGHSRYVYFGDFGIEYLPRNYFRVCRMQRLPGGKLAPVSNSSRTIYEVFGFFQSSFLKAIERFGIGSDVAELIERNKAGRESFEVITPEIQEYCATECRLLAELMETLRHCCVEADIKPRSWNGAGKLAAALHDTHKTPLKRDLDANIPADLAAMAGRAYFGGRFEVTRAGQIDGPVYEADINSAYPAAMIDLPCLLHGTWERLKPGAAPADLAGQIYIADVAFNHPAKPRLCGLPIRSQQGRIFWPLEGRGTYWGCEVAAAVKLGASVKLGHGWRYVKACECQQFDWVAPLYAYRKSLGKAKAGYPIKLGINSLYGKLAQRVGNPRWANYVWAGLITAATRAKLNHAISLAPDDIIMLATDGVYSRVRLPLDAGDNLGQWETAEHPRMFVVQPGLYWGPPKPKTRGVSPKYFAAPISATDPRPRTALFEDVWAEFRAADQAAPGGMLDLPAVFIPVTSFTGLKLAQSRNKPETAGVWKIQERRISFDYTAKRAPGRVWDGGHVVTLPLPGGPDLVSMSYAGPGAELAGIFEGSRELLEDQPDYVAMTPPYAED